MWIVSPLFDLSFIIAPGLLSALCVLLFSGWFHNHLAVSPLSWVALVLCVDVAHVYSTLFRTYFDKAEFEKRRTLYILAPLGAWLLGVVLYSQGALVFWRVAAYLAVFHFIRQQYGFMMIYTAREGRKSGVILEKISIYLATLYPILYWHTHPRNFSWFVEDDFLRLPWKELSQIAGALLCLSMFAFLCRELLRARRGEKVSLGKGLFLFSTALSWYVGIVLFNGDLAFTLTNVLAHGIPYIALVWVYQQKKVLDPLRRLKDRLLQPRSIVVYVLLLLVFAYLEEALWDAFVWREHVQLFGPFQRMLPRLHGSLLNFVVPLLTVPQLTHYILDGFIWKVRKPDPEFKELVESSTLSLNDAIISA